MEHLHDAEGELEATWASAGSLVRRIMGPAWTPDRLVAARNDESQAECCVRADTSARRGEEWVNLSWLMSSCRLPSARTDAPGRAGIGNRSGGTLD